MKIFALNNFPDFFNSAKFLMFKFDQIYSRPILELKELRSVEILWLSCIVPER
jgi:hypothetical protein